MNQIPKTDQDLIDRLEKSARAGVSKEEIAQQRVSFVYGNLPSGSAISREKVAQRIKEHEGT